MMTHNQMIKKIYNTNKNSIKKELDLNLNNTLDYYVNNVLNNFENKIIKLLDIKKSNRNSTEVLEVLIEDLSFFKEVLLKKTFKLSDKNEEEYKNQIILLETEIIFKNRASFKILNIDNLKEVSIKTDAVHSDKPNYKTRNENADIYFLTLNITTTSSEKLEFIIGYPRYFNYQNISYEICYDLKEMEENILNVILSHYQDYKENLTINKKI